MTKAPVVGALRRRRALRDRPQATPRVRKRLKRAERRLQIVREAARLFAEVGFIGQTRELAKRLGITQAAVYRHFPSKDALIDEVFRRTYVDLWDPGWDRLLKDRKQPLQARLIRFYQEYLRRFGLAVPVRLFMWANLEGLDFATKYRSRLTGRILRPIGAELRHQVGLPDFKQLPMTNWERELALALHGGIVFLAQRKHIYRMPLPDDLGELAALHVRIFLDGGCQALTDAFAGHRR